MKYLLTIEVQDDLIVVCRLLNVLRRKGVRLQALTMTLGNDGYALTTLSEMPDAEVDHLYHFLRRTEGVRQVAYYRQSDSEPASFILVEGDADGGGAARIQSTLPGARVVFTGPGRSLIEAEHRASSAISAPGVISFARMRSTREKVM